MYSVSAIALVACSVGVIRPKTMVRLLTADPSVSARFMNYLLLRKQHIEQALVDRLLNSSERRLARILLLLARSGNTSWAKSARTCSRRWWAPRTPG